MPEEEAVERAREDEREGKSPSTQASEFVREEMEHIREGEHGARRSAILQKGVLVAVKSLPRNAPAQPTARSSARAVGQRRSERCRDTRSASRANALHD